MKTGQSPRRVSVEGIVLGILFCLALVLPVFETAAVVE
jgi:hypothetical protein